jgi:hypothetical protein
MGMDKQMDQQTEGGTNGQMDKWTNIYSIFRGKLSLPEGSSDKFCHMLFGQHFVWVTDCYDIEFILSYDGVNLAILHLQM